MNVNGLSCKDKQLKLIDFCKFHRIDVLMIQEHNLRVKNKLCKEILNFFHVSINLAVASKGGTAIFIRNNLPLELIFCQNLANSRIMSLKVKIHDQLLHFVNIYAHSGSNLSKERDELFNNELLFYLRNNLDNTILGGDWNCVLSQRDTESSSAHISKVLLNMIRSIQFRDAWFIKHKHVEYTYSRNNHGSRLDRFYVKNVGNYVHSIKVVHLSFSDHSCVMMNLEIPDLPKMGKYYWKLNVTLLDRKDIKEKFKIEWGKIKTFISFYDSINTWWDMYAKKQIRFFFIKIGRDEAQMKYGLLHLLEHKLNRLYDGLNKTGLIDYNEVKVIKDRINRIKDQMLEGVKIRNRLQEQIEGEKISAYLIGQQAKIKTKKAITSIQAEDDIVNNINSGTIIKDKDAIELYISSYYKKLYKNEHSDEQIQNWFLQFVDPKLSGNDTNVLESNVTDQEIFKAINDMNVNKSPGIDGIPIEFYSKYWSIIHVELSEIIRNMINGKELQSNQRKAIITLIPKDGDNSLLKSWRPISLICSDVKIVAKILANRLNPIMPNIISENQFCVNGKSIVDCNSTMRDILYYSNVNNLTGAFINLDWEKAFDKVDWKFLIKIMKKLGFTNFIIRWLMNLYTDITSACLVNGNITKEFAVERGVRQGCPMSMLVYVIFQEPLYNALDKCNNIIPFQLENKQIKNLGYADDTTICVRNDEGFTETFKIIKKFENASNSKLNIHKTKVYGIGNWNRRLDWPICDLRIEVDYFCSLGLIFSNNYNTALDLNWKKICSKIKTRVAIMRCRNLNLYQKAVLVNSLLSSKIWYASHIYPFPIQYSKVIDTEIFQFIWNSKSNPVKREVLNRDKDSGGIGLINMFYKAKSIFLNTTLRLFLNSDGNGLIWYYLAHKVTDIFPITIYQNIRNRNTPYYDYAVDGLKKCKDIKGFPRLNSKMIYKLLLPDTKPSIEAMYPYYDWNNIWKNINFRYINVGDRPVLFKYCHEILTNNKRLYQIRIEDSPLCATCNVEDSNIHRFYFCQKVQDCLDWLRKLIFYFCGINCNSLLKIMSFDLPGIHVKNKNTLCIIISSYIACTWYNRDNLDYLTNKLKAKIIRDQKIKLLILGPKANSIFTENYCKSDINFIYTL